ncbi:MAG: hypothetical protein JNM63_08120 [Spirochaetia bacterium]|nr:hypothetical protein [Spirochaetia bacterium]
MKANLAFLLLALSSGFLFGEPATLKVAVCNHVNVGSQLIPPELQKNAKKIHYLNPMWFDILDSGKVAPRKGCEAPYADYAAFCKTNGILLLPIIRNFAPTAFLSDEAAGQTALSEIMSLVDQENFDGILLDLESLVPKNKEGFHRFLASLTQPFRKKKKLLMVATPAHVFNGEMDLAQVARDSDFLFAMFYDYTSGGTKRLGPTAPLRFAAYPRDVERDLKIMLDLGVPPEKIIMGVPFYGIDFSLNAEGKVAKMDTLYWSQIDRLRTAQKGKPEWDDESKNFRFNYSDASGTPHAVWYEDGKTLVEKMTLAKSKGLAGLGFWAITAKENADPEVWKKLGE